jgi:pimeloyl-ACP methyl ester carboxylesterase
MVPPRRATEHVHGGVVTTKQSVRAEIAGLFTCVTCDLSVAVDFPCFGRSGGELTVSETSVPRLSVWLLRFLEALGQRVPVMVAGYDIGGGVAQHLILAKEAEVPCLAAVNGIMHDSWRVPGVARFRDPAVAAATTRDDVFAARRVSVVKALGRPASEAEIAEYFDPWPTPGSLDPG